MRLFLLIMIIVLVAGCTTRHSNHKVDIVKNHHKYHNYEILYFNTDTHKKTKNK